ncbi:MAG: transketolase family protein [Actinomycetota bacterium]
MKATREAVPAVLIELGKAGKDIAVLDADLAKSTGTEKFGAAFPERYFDCGVAEQNMLGTAAGLAASGKTVFVGGFTVFSVGRAWDQLRNVTCYANLNVKLCSTHAGISVGEDGATHQTFEDIALTRVLPNMTVLVPADYYQAAEMLRAAADIPGPVFVRMGRPKTPFIYDDSYKFKPGVAEILRPGTDVTIIACGSMVQAALDAAEVLAGGSVEAEVINAATIKPLDAKTILGSAAKTGRVVTAEEHSVIGGLGGAVAELLSGESPVPVKRVGIQDRFGKSAPFEELFPYFGLTPEAIVEAARQLVVGS